MPPAARPLLPSSPFMRQLRDTVELAIRPILIELFGPNYRLNAQGCVVSQPGTTAQGWHVNSSHLFATAELPCHFVTCFVPLYSSSHVVGPTEFAVGSHRHTHRLGLDSVEQQYPTTTICTELLERSNALTMDSQPGDCNGGCYRIDSVYFR